MQSLRQPRSRYDVVVVGASAAGLYAAQLLAENGLSVGVFERRLPHRPARRTLIVTPGFGDVLDSGIPAAVTTHESGIMKLAAGRVDTAVSFVRPDPIIERGHLVERLKAAAMKAGVYLLYGHRFVGFDRDGVKFQCGWEDARVKTVAAERAVIGADGVLTNVAPAAGLERPPAVPILQAEIDLPPGWNPDVTQIWFDVDSTPYFYWIIPESEQRGVAGLIGSPRAPMRILLDQFLVRNGFEAMSFQGSQVALHHPRLRPWGRVGKTRVYLVGDAAGHVKVTTVGGTVTGLAGAAAAARAIVNGTSYRRELRRLKRELDLHWWIRWALERLDRRGYERLLTQLDGPAGAFLGRFHRDEMAKVFWRLPLVEPRLVGTGLRALFGRRS